MGVKLSEWRLKMTDGISAKVERITALGDKAAAKYGVLQQRMDKFTAGVRSAADEVPGLNRALSLATNPYILITAGVVGLGAGLGHATGRAMEFEKGMRQINTTARLNEKGLTELRDELLRLGGESTVPVREIPAAFNQVISAVGDTKQALAIFGPALKASQAGFTEIKTVADALTNTMGAVGNATPTAVLDTLFATVRVGKGEFADFAGYLPKIIPLANNVSIGYQEVAGAFALMTAKGQGAAEASTLLSNAMTALSKSEVIHGSASKAGFERSGIAIFDQAGKMRKLVDIVDDLSQKTTGLSDKQKQAFLSGLGLDAQASAAFSIMAQYSQELRNDVFATTNSAGELAAAFERSLNPADRFALLINRVNTGVTRLGYKLLPAVNAALGLVDAGITFVSTHTGEFAAALQAAAGAVTVLMVGMGVNAVTLGVTWVASMVSSVGATFLLQYALLAVRTAMFSIPIIGWIAAAVSGFIYLYQTSDKFRATLAGVAGVLLALWPPIKQLGVAIANLFNPAAFATNMAAFVQSVRNLDVGTAYSQAYDGSITAPSREAYDSKKAAALFGANGGLNTLNQSSALAKTFKLPSEQFGGKGKSGGPGGTGHLKDGLKSVNDGGRQVRNVVVNINRGLVEQVKIINGTNQASQSELENFIKETIIRAVSGAEQALN